MKKYTLPKKKTKYFVSHREKKNQPWHIQECVDLTRAKEIRDYWESVYGDYMKKKTWEVWIGTKTITHKFA